MSHSSCRFSSCILHQPWQAQIIKSSRYINVLLADDMSNDVHPGWWDPQRDIAGLKELLIPSRQSPGNLINLLILLTPIGWVAHFLHWSAYAIFLINLVALVPLAMLIGKLTEDLALRFGDTIGALCLLLTLGSCSGYSDAPLCLHGPLPLDTCRGKLAAMACMRELTAESVHACSGSRMHCQTNTCSILLDTACVLAGGLLNVTFGNAVELILSIIALLKGLNDIVTYSLIGSVLSNLLLVLGGSSCHIHRLRSLLHVLLRV